MDVILLERISRLGSVGDVVKVKNGFARNFLFPPKESPARDRREQKSVRRQACRAREAKLGIAGRC